MYIAYFGCSLGEQIKNWAPHKTCSIGNVFQCHGQLVEQRSPVHLLFKWFDTNLRTTATVVIFAIKGLSFKHRDETCFPDLDSERRPVTVW